jgi:pimeloyl-ACP methyl ester carboxylesterase
MPHRLNLPVTLTLLGTRFGVGWSWAEFDRERRARSLPAPMLVIVGEQDAMCPPEEARAIAQAARARLLLLPDAGHLDLWDLHGERLAEEIGSFLRTLPRATVASTGTLPMGTSG